MRTSKSKMKFHVFPHFYNNNNRHVNHTLQFYRLFAIRQFIVWLINNTKSLVMLTRLYRERESMLFKQNAARGVASCPLNFVSLIISES